MVGYKPHVMGRGFCELLGGFLEKGPRGLVVKGGEKNTIGAYLLVWKPSKKVSSNCVFGGI